MGLVRQERDKLVLAFSSFRGSCNRCHFDVCKLALTDRASHGQRPYIDRGEGEQNHCSQMLRNGRLHSSENQSQTKKHKSLLGVRTILTLIAELQYFSILLNSRLFGVLLDHLLLSAFSNFIRFVPRSPK